MAPDQGYEIQFDVEIGDKVSQSVAEAWAVGQRNGVDVGSSDPTYQNNAKYYAKQTQDAKDAAVAAINQTKESAITAVTTAGTQTRDEATEAISSYGEAVKAALPAEYDTYSAIMKLDAEYIPGTTQKVVYGEDGSVSQIQHKTGTANTRTDVFTFGDGTITETRTLATGEKMTIVTDLETLDVTITYAA